MDKQETLNQSVEKSFRQNYFRRATITILFLIFLTGILGWRIQQQGWQSFQDSLLFVNQTPKRSQQRTQPEFDFSNSIIPPQEIQHGGPPKDGIPALSTPKLIEAADAKYLKPTDRVISVVIDKVARAYPLKIMNYHEIVNDRIEKLPVAVTYCPLCDSSVVYDRRTAKGEREFGVSGLLFNSNVLMYDRGGNPESLWSQLMSKGVTGPGVKQTLKTLPLEVTSWGDWKSRFPGGKVLSDDTGYPRNYQTSPYAQYFQTPELMFPVNKIDERLPVKTRVLGVWSGKESIAFPLSRFSKEHPVSHETINGKKFEIHFNPKSQSLQMRNAAEGVEWMYTFWFAWSVFYPETKLYALKGDPR